MTATLRVLLATALLNTASAWSQPPNSPVPPTEQRSGRAQGNLLAIDLAAKRLTIQTADGPATFGLAPNTYIFRGKEKLAPDKLKTGDSLKLSWYRDPDGRVVIQRIKIDLPAPPESAP